MPDTGQPVNGTGSRTALVPVLRDLHAALDRVTLPYDLPGSRQAGARARLLADQLTDYVLPRLDSLDAPLLAVVGGSTGAGKSTLVNTLVGSVAATASAIRPTTRRPLLLHAARDGHWFDGDRVLGSLARVRVREGAAATPAVTAEGRVRELEVREARALPPGLALLDAPDIDSVVEGNRTLAAALLASADLWVFVTTASRYADAVPWEHLRAAAGRRAVVAVVLDRVPPGAREEVEADLRRRLVGAGLGTAPVFTVPETGLDSRGLLPEQVVAPLRAWLSSLAADAAGRAAVARRTLTGAVEVVADGVDGPHGVAAALDAQDDARTTLVDAAEEAHAEAAGRLAQATADGTLLRGEVLVRWQEYVGTGEFLRSLEAQVGRLRDRVGAVLRGRPAPAVEVSEAIGSSLASLVVAEARRAALATERAWRREGAAPYALAQALASLADEDALARRAATLVRAWQGDVLATVRREGADKRLTARLLSLGVNGVGVALMVVVFAHTGGLSGGEIGIAGGTAVLAQRVLEAVFGDQAMRRMAEQVSADLSRRVGDLLAERTATFTTALPGLGAGARELREAAGAVRAAVEEER